LNASQKRLFEEARKRNPDLKMPTNSQPANWTEDDLALIKQGVGDKAAGPGSLPRRPATPAEKRPPASRPAPWSHTSKPKASDFLRPDDGGRDIFFHVSRLAEGLATDLRPGTRVAYELGMDRTGKMAASSVRIVPAA
jgi:CspA family cold shock protein